jgi:hypothetical protein
MKTAMQELIDDIQQAFQGQWGVYLNSEKFAPYLEKEKKQIIDAHFNGMDKLATSLSEFLPIKHTMSVIQEIKNGGELHEDGEQYFNEKYKQNNNL